MERKQIPMPLQAQILMQAGLAVCSLIAGIAFLILFTGIVAFPFLLLAILASVNGWRVYHVAAHGYYLTLSSIVLKVERTAFLRRPKAVLVEAEGKALRVMLRSRLSAPKEGSSPQFMSGRGCIYSVLIWLWQTRAPGQPSRVIAYGLSYF